MPAGPGGPGASQPQLPPAEAAPSPEPAAGAVRRVGGARSELRRQLREQRRVRAIAMAVVVLLLLGAPMLYFGIAFATRDPVLNSLDRLVVPDWAAQSPEDRIISGSRWCFIDCRFRERTLESEGEPEETTQAYQAALREAGWARWEVPGCPLVDVDGDYTCWRRDEYTLDLWIRPPDCAYDPLNQRPDVVPEDAEPDAEAGDEQPPEGSDEELAECSGSVVEIKMQNRVADERGLPGSEPGPERSGPGSPEQEGSGPGSPAPGSPAPEETVPESEPAPAG